MTRLVNTNLRNEQVWLAVGSLMVLATVALAMALAYTRNVMIPFVLAVFITTVVSPVIDFQVVRWGVPKPIAIVIALLLVLAMMALLGVVMIVAVQTIINAADEYSDQVARLSRRLFAELKAHSIHVDQALISAELKSRLPGMITTAAGTVSTLLSNGLLIIFFVVFLMVGRNSHKRRAGIYAQMESAIRKYITTVTAISSGVGLAVGVILWALGLRTAWLFGVLAFLLNFIPNIGPIVASLLPLPVALAQFDDPWRIVAVVALPGAIHLIIGNFVEPRLMGRGLELHPVVVLLALAFWGLLWGVMGMVLAVPMVATLRIVLSRFTTTRPLGQLLAGRLPGTEPPLPIA
ncbi:MAG TPA: AI-2E family transporter [Planctomycetaceae bacterium]|jgi:AI-2 transport protein TqsA|nr:AI-2E family transporter [Planctomycetaceae bacterium]